jgi:hypothetical protein
MSTEIDPAAFQRWIDDYPKNLLGFELSEALAACVRATQTWEKTSTFTLKVSLAPGEGVDSELIVSIDVTTKLAKPKPPKVTFFATESGGLSRRDPSRQHLPGMENH